jgi:hypothetical protein
VCKCLFCIVILGHTDGPSALLACFMMCEI